MAEARELLREHARRLLAADKGLADKVPELMAKAAPELKETLESVQKQVGTLESKGGDPDLGLETIVARTGRPVLEVANDDFLVTGPEAALWEARLNNSTVRGMLKAVIPSVGRVEVDNHPTFTWVGTAWLIADDILVTNRHVAAEFALAGGRGFEFKPGWLNPADRMAARVDFRREKGNTPSRAFAVKDVLHIEPFGPDFAFLKVERTGTAGPLSPALRTATASPTAEQPVATVGYPAADSRIPEQELMTSLFGDVYNVKRLAPGQVQKLSDGLVMHDCTTLGGNSGSPIIDLRTGEVVGLHFSGLFLKENRGVPIGLVTSRLAKVLNPHRPTDPPQPETQPPPTANSVTVTVPLQINVSLGTPVANGQLSATVSLPAAATPTPTASIAETVAGVRAMLAGRTDVLAVKDGFVFRNGWITPDPAVVVVMKGQAVGPADLGLGATVGVFPVDVRAASPWDLAAATESVAGTLEGLTRTAYQKPSDFKLTPVNEEMTVTVHVSPDAGWPTLREFLKGTKKTLTVGMYDFTAPHIVKGVLDAVKDPPKALTIVLQEGAAMQGKPNDIEEEKTLKKYRQALGERFAHAPASVGKDHQFASAYHIKVAVRDSTAFWLSSGNWQSSNQPDHEIATGTESWDLLRDRNREWHVVIENANLAAQFEKFIQYDLKNAKADAAEEAVAAATSVLFAVADDDGDEERVAAKPTYFPPLTVKRKVKVQPLLTPDNYTEHVLKLIRSASRRVLFQNQSFNLLGEDANGNDKNDPRFVALTDALLDKQKKGLDVRVIMRGDFTPVGPLEQLQRRGFDMTKVRLQKRCHTKGIIVDGKRVLVGSHNWTNQGTLVNRDASLIFDDAEIADYFEELFWFDWNNLAKASVGTARPRRVTGDDEAVAGGQLVPWQEVVYGD